MSELDRPKQSHQPTEQHIQTAIDWLLHCEEQGIDCACCEALQQWLQVDERHQLAWQRIAAIHHVASLPDTAAILQDTQALTEHQNPFAVGKKFYAQYKGRLASVLLCAVALGLAKQSLWLDWALADYRSLTGEIKTISLSDGSVVTLASESAIDIQYADHERRIILQKGQMWVSVAKDQNRPLRVETLQGEATALGTIFAVQADNRGQSRVIVAESKVSVCIVGQPMACQVLRSNETIALTAKVLSTIDYVDATEKLAWQQKRLLANNMPLSEVLKALRPYHKGVLLFDESQMQGKMVSGVFPLDNTDEALLALQVLYPFEVKHYTDYISQINIK